MRKVPLMYLSEVIALAVKTLEISHNEACFLLAELELGRDSIYFTDIHKSDLPEMEYS